MAIVLGNKNPRWPSPTSFTTSYYRDSYGTSSGRYLPGFANDDAAGYTVAPGVNTINYYNSVGTAITSGVWNGGITAADFSGVTTFKMQATYMDASDNKLYMVISDTNPTPDKLKLCHVDKAGTLVQHAWQNVGTGQSVTISALQKDSSGNLFAFHESFATNARGFKVHFAVSDGAMTTSNLLPADAYGMLGENFKPQFGPTENNIYMNVYGIIGTYAINQSGALSGKILNATTGRGSMVMAWPSSGGRGPEVAISSIYNILNEGYYWRGMWGASGVYGGGGVSLYTITDMNNFVDAVARDLGYL